MFSIIPQLKCILLFGPKLFTFVCFSLREKELTNKSFRENLLYHWHYFDSPWKDQRRFSEFNSFRFSDTEAFHFRFEMLLEEQLEQVLELQTRVWVHIERYVQASVSWWTWPPLPRYQGTRIANKLWWRTYPAANMAAILNHPRAQKDWDPKIRTRASLHIAFFCKPPYTYVPIDDYMTVPFSLIPRNKRLPLVDWILWLKLKHFLFNSWE